MEPFRIIRVMRTYSFPLSDEKAAQAAIAGALDTAAIRYEREVRLGDGDVIDFMFDGGLGMEVKLRGAGRMAIWRQLERYARHDSVKALLLASNTAMGLPATILGKPAYYHSLGRNWL